MKKGIFLILSLVLFSFAFAQTDDTPIPPPLTAPWEVVEVSESPGPVPYPVVKDVMWSKYVWIEIDLREKRNQGLYFPAEPQGIYKSLGQVIIDALDLNNPDNENALPIYTNEHCNVKVARGDIKNSLDNSRVIPKFDPETGDYIGETTIDEPLTAAQIMYYRLKEVWFFDKNRGEFSVRILTIEPFFEYDKGGVTVSGDDDEVGGSLKSKRRLGNIKYDELRPYLAQQQYFNPKNTAMKLTFDDVITWKRYFSSYIIASSDQQNNREIQDYIKNPIDQRLESERILNEMRNLEDSFWEY